MYYSFKTKVVFIILFLFISSKCFSVYHRIGGIKLTSEYPRQIETFEDLAITLERHSFNIYNVSDLCNPILKSEFPFTEKLNSMTLHDNFAFISACDYDLHIGYYFIVDFSNPSNPSIIYEYSTNTPGSHYVIKRSCIYNDHAYVDLYDPQDWDSYLLIFDVSDPFNPTLVSSLFHDLTVNCMAVNHDYCYLFGFGTETCLVIDVSDNINPEIVMTYSDIHFNSINLIDDIGYCGCNAYFRIYDFSDPFNLNQIAECYTGSMNSFVDILGNKAYIASQIRGLTIVDITHFTELFIIGVYDTQINGSSGTIQVKAYDENTAFLTEVSGDGFLFIDISDPAPPASLLTSFDYRCYKDFIAIQGDLLVLVNDGSIYFMNVSDPENPEQLYTYGLGTAGSIKIHAIEDYVFLTFVVSDVHRLFVFDTSDLNNISRTGSCFLGNVIADDMCTYDEYLYLTNE